MDVAEWLRGVGLEKYMPAFRANDIDGEVLRRLRGVAGVAAVGMTTNAGGRLRLFVEGAPAVPLQDRPTVLHSSVSEGYARAIGMRLVAGRWLTDVEPTRFDTRAV